ncbi:hypothetical protein EV191_10191 [Tamaricihabitans halophyticus]|uniref:Uncharacterized protein n=1 Tax=Tamaricihabitans halophyticus TaxID=1262583 RepID=A0A4R2R914_9PSEU|nr:hypothetical protein [Tamaricihabitans halophyticus]TCP56151.1 hypothetical protein EV191_10191 [Tamaricihabitans halophyticus]
MTVTRIWSMAEGFGQVSNLLGVGDPNVHKIGDQWWMFLGGFQDTFKNNVFSACLPPGAPLSSTAWAFHTDASDPRRAMSLIPQPGEDCWDGAGLHTPRYVTGFDASGNAVERIYYSGRGSAEVIGNTGTRYAIGMLERSDGAWHRRAEPVFGGTEQHPFAVEPTVHYAEGKWRMWYNAAPTPGPGEQPRFRIKYTESRDGETGWSAPVDFFAGRESYFDTSIVQGAYGYELVASAGGNHFGTEPFPEQGLWWYEAKEAAGDRSYWSAEPVKILEVSGDVEWYANGVFGPSIQYGDTEADRDTMYVFFTGTYQPDSPPFPAPFFFAVGRAMLARPA